ncbi:MAG: hypothetical protein JWL95_1461, partial [Gemmatimonadetes bacterium]|nr:hypothetical protein [Gemmatimonadota bacterium]
MSRLRSLAVTLLALLLSSPLATPLRAQGSPPATGGTQPAAPAAA